MGGKYISFYKGTDSLDDKHKQKWYYTKKDKYTNVIVGWNVKDDKTWMTSAYIKEVDKNGY